jgi:hypothetical protein
MITLIFRGRSRCGICGTGTAGIVRYSVPVPETRVPHVPRYFEQLERTSTVGNIVAYKIKRERTRHFILLNYSYYVILASFTTNVL